MSATPEALLTSATTRPSKSNSTQVVFYVILVIMTLLYIVPIYLALVTSLKSGSEVQHSSTPWGLPISPTFDNFGTAWAALASGFLNSVYLAIPGVLISSVLGSLNGYVLSKWKFKGSNTIFTLILFGMFIPYQSVLIPLKQFLVSVHMSGIPSLILVHVVYGIPITTLIFRNYYAGVPKELIESGTIDGAGFFGIYRLIVLPVSVPAFVVVLIWQFTAIWNEFLFAVTLNSGASQPITVALAGIGSSQAGTDYGVQMAGSLITALPTLLVYIFLSRYFIRGLLAGSVKG